jgi:hypothetical protein
MGSSVAAHVAFGRAAAASTLRVTSNGVLCTIAVKAHVAQHGLLLVLAASSVTLGHVAKHAGSMYGVAAEKTAARTHEAF